MLLASYVCAILSAIRASGRLNEQRKESSSHQKRSVMALLGQRRPARSVPRPAKRVCIRKNASTRSWAPWPFLPGARAFIRAHSMPCSNMKTAVRTSGVTACRSFSLFLFWKKKFPSQDKVKDGPGQGIPPTFIRLFIFIFIIRARLSIDAVRPSLKNARFGPLMPGARSFGCRTDRLPG